MKATFLVFGHDPAIREELCQSMDGFVLAQPKCPTANPAPAGPGSTTPVPAQIVFRPLGELNEALRTLPAPSSISSSPALIFLDVSSTGSGPIREALRRIRKTQPEVPIAICAELAVDSADFLKGLGTLENLAFLRKPFHPLEVQQLARVLCSQAACSKRREEMLGLVRAIEQSPMSVVITDPTGAIEYVNPQFVQITGYTREELIGANPRILKSMHTPPEVYEAAWKTLAAGEVWRGEFCNRRKNGELYWEAVTLSGLVDSNNRVTHYVGVKHDITQLKETQAQLELETSEREQLRGALQVSGGVCHELNQPLQTALTTAETLLLNWPATHPDYESALRIRESVERLGTVTHRLMALTHLRTMPYLNRECSILDLATGESSMTVCPENKDER